MGRQDSNLRMAESKSTALPLGDAPIGRFARGATRTGRTIYRLRGRWATGARRRVLRSRFPGRRAGRTPVTAGGCVDGLGREGAVRALSGCHEVPMWKSLSPQRARKTGRWRPPRGVENSPRDDRRQIGTCGGGARWLYSASRSRSVAQSGSAPRSGRGGRRFKSCHSDHRFQPGPDGFFSTTFDQ